MKLYDKVSKSTYNKVIKITKIKDITDDELYEIRLTPVRSFVRKCSEVEIIRGVVHHGYGRNAKITKINKEEC